MSNDIISKPTARSAQLVTNVKEQKINNFDIKDSQVTFNVTLPANGNQNEMMLAISQFSNEYYNLIVTVENIFDEASHAITLSSRRCLQEKFVPKEIYERCSSLSPEGIEELKTIPAIITSEKEGRYYSEVDTKQMAVYGYITKVKKHKDDIKVFYQPICLIPLHILCENPIDYDVDVDCAISDFNSSAWTVKKVNLFETFRDTGIMNAPSPA